MDEKNKNRGILSAHFKKPCAIIFVLMHQKNWRKE
jgi:hypothetical protein